MTPFDDLYGFTDLYDSVLQRNVDEQSRRAGVSAHMKAFHGRLRIDLAIRNRLILTDTQVYDGRFFVGYLARHADETEWQLIRDRAAVLVRNEDPGACRMEFCRSHSVGRKQFAFSLLEDPARVEIERVLANEAQSFAWPSLLALFHDVGGVDQALLQQIEEGWRLLDQNLMPLQKWHTHPGAIGFHIDSYGLEKFGELLIEIREPQSKEVLKRVYEYRRKRSKVDELMSAELAATDPSSAVCKELRRIEDWYHRGYNRALARSHGAHSIECMRAGPTMALRLEFTQHAFTIGKGVCERIAELPSLEFKKVVNSLGKEIRSWRAAPSAEGLGSILEKISNACDNRQKSDLGNPPTEGPLGARKAFDVLGGSDVAIYTAPFDASKVLEGPVADVRAVTELRRVHGGGVYEASAGQGAENTLALIEHRR
jgi:hypothetical protein